MTTLTVPELRTASRWAGWSLLIVTASLLIVHGGAMVIAGQRVSGTSDVGLIRDYYAHEGLLPLYWQHGIFVLTFGLFVAAFYRLMVDKVASVGDRLLLGAGTMAAAAVIPLGLTELGLQAGMVQLATSGATEGLLALFAAWDWIYNSFFYWLEVVWVGLFSLVALRTVLLPRWIGILGMTIAGLHVFHSTALMFGIPDLATTPGTALFVLWFVATGVHLVRTGRARPRVPSEEGVTLSDRT